MSFLSRLLAPFAALAFAACAATTPAETSARPGLWKLSDPDTTIYLFGTIHLLPEGFDWRTPAIERAIAGADALVLEIVDQGDPGAPERYRALATSPGLPPLAERVPADKRDELAALMAKAGFAEGRLDSLETWAAAIALGGALYTTMGVSVDHGVETQLRSAFAEAGKPIAGIETTAQQLGYFDTLPEPSQRRLLLSILEESDGANAEFDAMSAAWARGDTDAIAVTFDDELRISPELADILIRQRNADWAEWIESRLDTPGTVLVAVGAGHLAGDDSLQTMLAAKGLSVERVQ